MDPGPSGCRPVRAMLIFFPFFQTVFQGFQFGLQPGDFPLQSGYFVGN